MKKYKWGYSLVLCLLGLFLLAGMYSQKAAAEQLPVPEKLMVYEGGRDRNRPVLIWEKPENEQKVSGYHIYVDGKYEGTTTEQDDSMAFSFIQALYEKDSDPAQQKISRHYYKLRQEVPSGEHSFLLRPVDRQNREGSQAVEEKIKIAETPAVFSVRKYGAHGDGKTDDTAALQAAIAACSPGAVVEVPAGIYITGPLWLKSDMTLHLEKDAVLLGSEDASAYLYQDKEGKPAFYALINAGRQTGERLHDIRITGEGRICGDGWQPSSVENAGLPVYEKAKNTMTKGSPGPLHVLSIGKLAKNSVVTAMDQGLSFKEAYPRRPNLITLENADQIYLEGITVQNPANHTLGFYHTSQVTLFNVKVESYDANNGDGLNFADSDGLIVFDSVFDTGDDDINFSAGQGKAAQKNMPTRNIWIFNNYIRHGHGGIVAGSHTGAWIENILAEDNVLEFTQTGLRCKTNKAAGGGARHIVFRDNRLENISQQPFIFTSVYTDPNAAKEYASAENPGVFMDIVVKNCRVTGQGKPSIQIEGLENALHRDLHFENIYFENTTSPVLSFVEDSSFDHLYFENRVDEETWKTDHVLNCFRDGAVVENDN